NVVRDGRTLTDSRQVNLTRGALEAVVFNFDESSVDRIARAWCGRDDRDAEPAPPGSIGRQSMRSSPRKGRRRGPFFVGRRMAG
ncbi:MAG: hypothetical protein ACYC6Y_12055, partial [Thermoguttaceae bacterium]